jgi:ABC-2 type transport system permease protein
VQPKLEGILTQALGQPVIIQTDGNLLYPPSDGVLLLSLATINWVLMVLMMGVFLVPHLLFEEKQTKTMQALLVSPASISQVIAGKALAGSFYILVTAVVIFSIFWADVVHWDAAILFVIGGAIFSIAMGLVLGSFYEKQQDMVGWMTALILLLTGSVLVSMLGMELPDLVKRILPWVPSVALAEVCRAAFSETVSTVRVWTKLGTVLAVSLPLYALVIWKVRRSDR